MSESSGARAIDRPSGRRRSDRIVGASRARQRELQGMLAPKAYSDPRILDWGARAYLAGHEDHLASWTHFMKSMRARRLLSSQ